MITVAPISQTHISKEHFLLYCKGKGPGNLDISWFKGDKEVRLYMDYEVNITFNYYNCEFIVNTIHQGIKT